MKRLIWSVGFVLSLSVAAYAHSYKLGVLQIGHAWTALPQTPATTAPIYLPLLNTGSETDELIGASSPWAEKIEIRQTSDSSPGQILKTITLAPNAPVAMRPGGLHLLAVGLTRSLHDNDRIPLTLQFKKAGNVDVEAIAGPPH